MVHRSALTLALCSLLALTAVGCSADVPDESDRLTEDDANEQVASEADDDATRDETQTAWVGEGLRPLLKTRH